MLKIKKSQDRGYNKMGWLESYHSFSFANYYNPAQMNYSHLRVINEDKVAPFNGFGMHPHKDMEIITFMLGGTIEHKDNMGNVGRLTKGNVQLMRAGTGVFHSEMNPSNETAHLLQIWIMPEEKGLQPGWWEKSFDSSTKNDIEIIAEPVKARQQIQNLSPEIKGKGLRMAQNGYVLRVSSEVELDFEKFGVSHVYYHQATGTSSIESASSASQKLEAGWSAQGEQNGKVKIVSNKESILLVFVFPK